MKYLLTLFALVGFVFQFNAQVTWDGEAGDGLWSSKGNWSKDELPIASDEVIIGQDFVVLVDVSTTVKEISLEDEGVMNVAGSIELEIEESERIGLEIARDAEVTNEGSILILNADFIGILNHGHLYNSHGLISVDNSNFTGIRNFQHISNTGDIIIESCLENALFNYGVLENENSIILKNNIFKGLTNDSMLVNRGQIMINATTNGTALINSDTLYNELQAIIKISQASENGVSNTGFISNRGKLAVANTERGIMNYSTLLNSDSIEVRSATGLGMYSNDSLYNSATGYIYIDDTGGSGISLDAESRVHNVGIIKIKNVAWGILNYGYVKNEDLIRIDSVIHGIDTDGVFVNESLIAVVNASEEGLINDSSFYNEVNGSVGLEDTQMGLINNGLFVNNSAIGIGTFLESGLVNEGLFSNETSASIGIINGAVVGDMDIGIENDSTILNYGNINILMTGIGVENSDSIYNSGGLSINEFSSLGIRNIQGAIINAQTGSIELNPISDFDTEIVGLDNDGLIELEGKMNIFGLDSIAINNQGTIHVKGIPEYSVLAVSPGAWLNQGALLIDHGGAVSCIGVFINNGSSIIHGKLDLFQRLIFGVNLNVGSLFIGESGIFRIEQFFPPRDALESLLNSTLECYGILEIITAIPE